MSWFGSAKTTMVAPAQALPGRASYAYPVAETNVVLGTSMHGPWSPTTEVLYVGMGCFWGAEKKFWQLPGVVTTAVGYQGGFTPYPTYEETCTAATGHTETVLVAYEPAQISTYEILKTFWENHDPTTEYRQGNDIGTQYRSALYWTNSSQSELIEATRDAYANVLADRGFDPISTEIVPADGLPFYYAEEYHQQYLHKVPHGYQCAAETGVPLPALN
jgi:peptide-methionine (S)-S-oxide reductase